MNFWQFMLIYIGIALVLVGEGLILGVLGWMNSRIQATLDKPEQKGS